MKMYRQFFIYHLYYLLLLNVKCTLVFKLMKKQPAFYSGCRKVFAALLLFTFFLIPIATVLHYHNDNSTLTGNPPAFDVKIAFSECQICDYLVEKQSKHLNYFSDTQLLIQDKNPVKVNPSTGFRIYGSYLREFTNRGPPSV